MGKLENPTLAQVLKEAVRNALLDVHTSMPGKVISYDVSTQSGQIQPLLKRKFKTLKDELELPIVNKVPFIFPGSLKSIIHVPVEVGMTGLLVFSERSLDNWLSGDGKPASPDDPKTHDLSDGVFIPGLRTFSQALSGLNGEYVTVKNDKMKIELSPDGKISIQGASGELLQIVSDFMDHVKSFAGNVKGLNVLVSSGSSAGSWPLDPGSQSAISGDESNFSSDKSKIDGLKI